MGERVKKKGQAVMETLANYGWVILILMAVIAAIAYIVFSNRGSQERFCIIGDGFTCNDFQMSNYRISVNLINGRSATLIGNPDGNLTTGDGVKAILTCNDGYIYTEFWNEDIPPGGKAKLEFAPMKRTINLRSCQMELIYTEKKFGALPNKAVAKLKHPKPTVEGEWQSEKCGWYGDDNFNGCLDTTDGECGHFEVSFPNAPGTNLCHDGLDNNCIWGADCADWSCGRSDDACKCIDNQSYSTWETCADGGRQCKVFHATDPRTWETAQSYDGLCKLGFGCDDVSDCYDDGSSELLRCGSGKCASCNDEIKAPDESCKDGGGSCASLSGPSSGTEQTDHLCLLGKECGVDSDCYTYGGTYSSLRCAGVVWMTKTCAACNDGAQAVDETYGVDCGGPCIGTCALGLQCSADAQCASGYCRGTPKKCVSCTDGIKNLEETDIGPDCGGAICAPLGYKCDYEQVCSVNSDCRSNKCCVPDIGSINHPPPGSPNLCAEARPPIILAPVGSRLSPPGFYDYIC
ncbi:MAG: hypothetical protein ABIH41_01995 [Nanoarchaeota archaeon]